VNVVNYNTDIQYRRKQAKDPLDLVQPRKLDRLLDHQLRLQDDQHQQQERQGLKYLNHLPLLRLRQGFHRVEKRDKYAMEKLLLELLISSHRFMKSPLWSWARLMRTKVREEGWMEYRLKCRKLGSARI
jgi:hypothetical protein